MMPAQRIGRDSTSEDQRRSNRKYSNTSSLGEDSVVDPLLEKDRLTSVCLRVGLE
jgi:hypothetical protein